MTHTLGHRLRLAREQKGLSLQDVAHETKIPVARLRDLEEDTYTTFGGLIYARSFLKDYSQRMGVDAHEILEEMHAPPLGGAQDYLVKSYGAWAKPTRKRPKSEYANSPVMSKGRSLGTVAGISVGVLMVGMGMLFAGFFGERHPVSSTPMAPAPVVETETAQTAVLPETREVPFSVPKALPAEDDKAPAAVPASLPLRKAQPAGVIPKALPVEMPKTAKAH